MSRESILKIQETERAAEKIVADAQARAQEMIAAAEAEGRALCTTTEAEAAASLAAVLEQLRERTDGLLERMANERIAQVEEMKKNVSLRRKIAEKIIIRGFERKCR